MHSFIGQTSSLYKIKKEYNLTIKNQTIITSFLQSLIISNVLKCAQNNCLSVSILLSRVCKGKKQKNRLILSLLCSLQKPKEIHMRFEWIREKKNEGDEISKADQIIHFSQFC